MARPTKKGGPGAPSGKGKPRKLKDTTPTGWNPNKPADKKVYVKRPPFGRKGK